MSGYPGVRALGPPIKLDRRIRERLAAGQSLHPADFARYPWLRGYLAFAASQRASVGYVDHDMGGSFRQPYPSVAVMNQRSFRPVSVAGFGTDVVPSSPDSAPTEADRLHACGTKVYSGLSQIVYLAAFVILVPYAFEKGRAHARGR